MDLQPSPRQSAGVPHASSPSTYIVPLVSSESISNSGGRPTLCNTLFTSLQ